MGGNDSGYPAGSNSGIDDDAALEMTMLEEMDIDFLTLKRNAIASLMARKIPRKDSENLVIYVPLAIYFLLNFSLLLVS